MRLKGKKVVCLVEADFEDLELWYPVMRLREEGAEVLLAGPERGAVYKGKYGVPATADLSFDELDPEEFDGLLIPGGWAPDKLRRDPRVLRTVRSLHEAGKPIGQICHAGWVLISARILQGNGSLPPPASGTTWRTPAPAGWMSRWSSTETWFPAVVPRICPSTPRPFATCWR